MLRILSIHHPDYKQNLSFLADRFARFSTLQNRINCWSHKSRHISSLGGLEINHYSRLTNPIWSISFGKSLLHSSSLYDGEIFGSSCSNNISQQSRTFRHDVNWNFDQGSLKMLTDVRFNLMSTMSKTMPHHIHRLGLDFQPGWNWTNLRLFPTLPETLHWSASST